ncbi:50S ribosomal protein L33 [Candidatus Dependentiae bacterium]|nr:50S ribosomal protein L33 [Candidatus Dependentiae bacterium]
MAGEVVILACEICKLRNYSTTRNKKTNKEKISLKKYCKKCRKHTLHKETK